MKTKRIFVLLTIMCLNPALSQAQLSNLKSGNYQAIGSDSTSASGTFSQRPDADIHCNRHVEVDLNSNSVYVTTYDRGDGKCEKHMQKTSNFYCKSNTQAAMCVERTGWNFDYSYQSEPLILSRSSLMEALTILPDGGLLVTQYANTRFLTMVDGTVKEITPADPYLAVRYPNETSSKFLLVK